MNNKKNKSKSRSKINKTSLGTDSAQEKIDNIESVTKPESSIPEESRVPEIVNEPVVIEQEQLVSDSPKKPKRNKGKKKKEAQFEDIKTANETIGVTDDAGVTKDNVDNATTEVVTPAVRKKKKKTKKHDGLTNENIEGNELNIVSAAKDSDTEKDINLPIDENVQINLQNLAVSNETIHKDDTNCKKKRKKKHRNDSESKDVPDSCTLAFQKLMEPSSSHIETDVSNKNELVQLLRVNSSPKDNNDLIEMQTVDISQTKESCKITGSREGSYKESVPETTSVMLNQTIMNEDCTFLKHIENEEVKKERSPKPKAKIAKPVQKKRKPTTACESPRVSSSNDIGTDCNKCVENEILITDHIVQDTNIDCDSFKDKTVTQETISNIVELQRSVNDFDNVHATETNRLLTTKDEFDRTESLSIVGDITQSKQEQETLSADKDDSEFVEVKTGKSKKKRSKVNLTTPNIDQQSAKTEEVIDAKSVSEVPIKDSGTTYDTNQKIVDINSVIPKELNADKLIIPDLIEYPRSTSQQYVDNNNNNNTFIQEITASEEIRLAIPIYMPTPTIQGSGESPEATDINEPVAINVTEVIPLLDSNYDGTRLKCAKSQSAEKTDIKSKMIEVNKDMEELRKSIERSLAELTAIEKSDTEVEKEFEELFQNQMVKPVPTNTIVSQHEDAHCSSNEKEIDKDKKFESKTDTEIKTTCLDSKITETAMEKQITEHISNEMKFDKNIGSEKVLILETDNIATISENKDTEIATSDIQSTPVCPARRDKGKNKSKKKDKKGVLTSNNTNTPITSVPCTESASSSSSVSAPKSQETKNKSKSSQEKGKQQTTDGSDSVTSPNLDVAFEPIENFEDALTSSVDDINNTFEMIAKDAAQSINSVQCHNNPQINVVSPKEDTEEEKKYDEKNEDKKQKQTPISRPKNLLGHPNIPASSNKNDFKKEKNKSPNMIQAKVKIKDSVEIEKASSKQSKKSIKDSYELETNYRVNENDDLIYKYSFRKVFIQSTCHVCKKNLVHRLPCQFCSLIFYCSQKHKDEDWPHHQSLCFAVSTIAHLKEQKHIYANTQNIEGHNYRLLRMQMILACEKILNRKLIPWEQEALLYPRICADIKCREWNQGQLKDCEGCGQVSYCSIKADHLPQSHQRWCKSYALYQKLVNYQLTKGRLEPRLPTKILKHYQMPEKINDVLGSMYEEKIDMDDTQYAALTQIATGPLTAAYCYQFYSSKLNSICANGARKKSTFTVHVIGAELPFEVDALNKWEIFFLHLRSDVQDLRVVMVGPDINSSKLPLDLLGKIQLCEHCQLNKRRVQFEFHDNQSYHDYYQSDGFSPPDIVCAFNSNIQRSSLYDTQMWPSTINCILKQRVPLVLTSYTVEELRRDLGKVRECARVDFNVVSEIKHNPFCSVRPDRNFITDHETPLLFKNYSYCILCGTL